MFTIGQFAQLCQVSIRTLRYYADRGLVQPAHVDASTGHRYYTGCQVADINRVLALKDLGFTLTEIADLLIDGTSPDQLRGMLRLREHEAARAAEAEQRRLGRIRASIDLLAAAPDLDEVGHLVVVKSLPEARVAVARGVISDFDDDLPALLHDLFGQVFAAVHAEGVQSTGPHLAWYGERPDGRIDVAAGLPIPGDVELELLDTEVLPAATRAATSVHVGRLSPGCEGYRRLQRWMVAADEQPASLSREVYLDSQGPPDDWVTELQFILNPKGTS